MNESYAETAVKRETTLASMGLKLIFALGIVAGVVLLFTKGLLSFVGAALVVAIIYYFPRLEVEYEYIFVDGQLDFDKIMGNSKRKSLLRIDFEQVEVMAPMNSHALDSFKNVQCEVKDFSSRSKDRKPYVIIANAENKMLKILFEPDEKMVKVIKQKSPRKVSAY